MEQKKAASRRGESGRGKATKRLPTISENITNPKRINMKQELMISDKPFNEIMDEFVQIAKRDENKYWSLKAIADWVNSYNGASVDVDVLCKCIQTYLKNIGIEYIAYPEGYGYKIDLIFKQFIAFADAFFPPISEGKSATFTHIVDKFNLGPSLVNPQLRIKKYLEKWADLRGHQISTDLIFRNNDSTPCRGFMIEKFNYKKL